MKLRLEDPTPFSKSVDLISELVTEVRIRLNEFGLSIVAIDPANVAMVSLKIPKSAFSEFEVGQEEKLGVNLDNLKKVLRRAGKSSALMLERQENSLEIRIEDKIKRIFTLNLIEIDSEEKDFPTHLEFSSRIEINSQDLIDSIDDCSIVGDSCSFIVEDGKFIIASKETNSARSEFSEDLIEMKSENCRARYSLEYLQKFLKAGKQFPKVVLNFANDHPLKLDFKSEHLVLSFLLAPRVEIEN